MQCGECRYWAFKKTGVLSKTTQANASHGYCLRYPPTPVADTRGGGGTLRVDSLWPETQRGHWCGEFSAREAEA
jgi:hypothetical protein